MNASNRADKLMLTPMNDVPAPAIAYAKYLGKKYGMCGEVYMTAFAHFAECFEGAEKSNDSLYVANDEARAFFAGYRAADSQRPTGDDIVDTLREALAQPEQEPYAYTAEGECWSCRFTSKVDTEFRLKALNIPLEKLRYLYLHPTPIPEGWVMVPKEPTKDMSDVFWSAYIPAPDGIAQSCSFEDFHDFRYMYKAMLAAAPKPEDVQ